MNSEQSLRQAQENYFETPFFLKSGKHNLFGVLHEPKNSKPDDLKKESMGIVFCHPFAEEKLFAHRTMLNIARSASNEGIYCLRFDYMGHGDSEGNFEDSTIETRLFDIRCAISHLKSHRGIKRICLLGVRLGATLAAMITADSPDIETMILISPVVNGERYNNQCLRSNLSSQMAAFKKIIKDRKSLISDLMDGHLINIDGYLITKTLYLQMKDINLQTASLGAPQNVLLLQVSPGKNKQISKEMNELYMRYKTHTNNAQISTVDEYPFWNEIKVYVPYARKLEEEIMNWLLTIPS